MKKCNFLIGLLAVFALVFTLTGCPSPEEPHVHTYSTEWTNNATHHWHEATCGHDLNEGEAAHTFGEWTTTKQPTVDEAGEKERECSVCHFKETDVIAKLTPSGDPNGDPQPQTPQFTITYQSAYATAPGAKTVDAGYALTAADLPALTQPGYVFGGWNKAVGFVVSGNVEVIATWTLATDTPYTVEHYQQNLADAGYTLKDTENKTGTTGAMTQAAAKTYAGFSVVSGYENAAIAADGSTVVKIYYNRLSSAQFNLTVTANDISITPAVGGYTLTLTPAEGFTDYAWTLNGQDLDESCVVDDETHALTFNKLRAGYGVGGYMFTLKAVKDGIAYTASAGYYVEHAPTAMGRWDNSADAYYSVIDGTVHVFGTGAMTVANYLEGWGNPPDVLRQAQQFIIEDGITEIGAGCFQVFDEIRGVSGGKDVTVIGAMAFAQCPHLETIHGFSNLTVIGDNAFSTLDSFTSSFTFEFGGTEDQWNAITGKPDLTVTFNNN